MKVAARNIEVPIFFIQAENDYDTTPTRVLSDIAIDAHKQVRAHVFPSNGTTTTEGRAFCAGGDHPPWGDEVMAFVRDATVARAAGRAMK